MSINDPTVFIEISNSEFIFLVGTKSDQHELKLIYEKNVPIQGIKNNQILDIDIICNIIKDNILEIEKNLNFTLKEFILILNNFEFTFLNLSGFKKLNGSQLVKENITYILNSLKSNVSELEKDKKILHIFNSQYNLDKKKIENIPIGLFGDFYSHELSFSMIKNNDLNNLQIIFEKCNLRIKKIFLKGFLDGVNLISKKNNIETFFKIDLNPNFTRIIFFKNSALKFIQNFDYGSDLIIQDISKIISLKVNSVRKIILNNTFEDKINRTDLLEKEYFENINFRKIKKSLIFEIAKARIEEISEKVLFKNINLESFIKSETPIFLSIYDVDSYKCFKNCYENCFSQNKNYSISLDEEKNNENYINNASKIVHFGWNKEAVPVIQAKKSLIARFFHLLFR